MKPVLAKWGKTASKDWEVHSQKMRKYIIRFKSWLTTLLARERRTSLEVQIMRMPVEELSRLVKKPRLT
jgi:hypothetical protein